MVLGGGGEAPLNTARSEFGAVAHAGRVYALGTLLRPRVREKILNIERQRVRQTEAATGRERERETERDRERHTEIVSTLRVFA